MFTYGTFHVFSCDSVQNEHVRIEGVHRIVPLVTLDVMPKSPFFTSKYNSIWKENQVVNQITLSDLTEK